MCRLTLPILLLILGAGQAAFAASSDTPLAYAEIMKHGMPYPGNQFLALRAIYEPYIREADFETFKQAFDEEAGRQLDEEALQGVIESDGELAPPDINLDLAECLRNAGPWGQHFPEPLFDGEFEVDNWRVVGERHLKMQLLPADSDQPVDAIAFNADAKQLEAGDGFIRAAYRLDVNSFRNKKTAQLIVEYFEAL